jgi:folate-binding protein YgfZ
MQALLLHEFHGRLGARFGELNGREIVSDYGDLSAEYVALQTSAAVLDLSFRSRLCLTGADRQKFLNGQVTNNVKDLKTGEGCYAALITAKGKMQSDLNIYCLEGEILLDFEPGLTAAVAERLEKYIIADDVQVVDVSPHYGLLSVQGPGAQEVVTRFLLGVSAPTQPMNFVPIKTEASGEIYLMNHARTGSCGVDVFVPVGQMEQTAEKLIAAARTIKGGPCGWEALEMARIEAGIPRFGVDMDSSNLPPEAGIEGRAISYTKGCYIGQEVIARIRTYGQVAKALRGLRLSNVSNHLPKKGDKLFLGDKEVGYVTSAVMSPKMNSHIAFGYVRREANKIGTELKLKMEEGEASAVIVEIPFD